MNKKNMHWVSVQDLSQTWRYPVLYAGSEITQSLQEFDRLNLINKSVKNSKFDTNCYQLPEETTKPISRRSPHVSVGPNNVVC